MEGEGCSVVFKRSGEGPSVCNYPLVMQKPCIIGSVQLGNTIMRSLTAFRTE